MACSLDQWRCAIGCFYTKFSIHVLLKYCFKLPTMDYIVLLLRTFVFMQFIIFVQVLNPRINIVYFLILLLLICGDIHPNPGPNSDISSISSHTSDLLQNGLSIMHINIRSLRNKINFLRIIENI